MANLVFYRKYRPQTFAEIVGQEHVVQTLSNALSQDMISHAYLFTGPRGSGKTSLARLLAKAVNCEKRKGFEPCNTCSSCTEVVRGQSLDLLEIDAASHRGIDDIRELRDGIRFSPVKSKYKVFILDEAHQLSKDAANALLKTLEEPPAHAIFILATTEIHKMIPTIISRCQRFDFRKLTLPEIVKRLESIAKKEKANIEKPALELIALHSGGSIRDGESLLDQALTFGGMLQKEKSLTAEDIKDLLGITDTATISQFVAMLADKKGAEAVQFLNETLEKGHDPQEFAKALVSYLRQALIVKIHPEAINPMVVGLTREQQEKLQQQAAQFTHEELHRAVSLFLEAENTMRYASIPQLPLELTILEILDKKE
ncbi:MAG: DNA polymerase III subunit gamma/tau [Chloroflexi bacterium]|nr:DNA polymerase III subunit gamma/tau [Chloroflexota bacterium]